MSREKYITLPIITVLFTVAYLYYATVFVVIDGWLGLQSAAGIANAVGFSVVAVMSLVGYGIAAVRDPGYVPSGFVPDAEDQEMMPVHEIKRKGGEVRYCQKCSRYKPPRSHHCRVCKRCILKMDHHCVWINNCVGHANYKVFLLSMVYAVIACIHSLILLFGSAANDVHKDQQQSGGSFKTSYIICGVLLVPLTLALGFLLSWHIYLIMQNKTTIEYHEGVRATWSEQKVGNTYRHPYDLGVYENLVRVFGPNICCWICPRSNHIGSGLRFQTSYDTAPSTVTR